MFAQRAKLIKNQAVVNQENTSAQYWKNMYLDLVKFGRSLTAPSLSKQNKLESKKGSHSREALTIDQKLFTETLEVSNKLIYTLNDQKGQVENLNKVYLQALKELEQAKFSMQYKEKDFQD